MRHGIARALLEAGDDVRAILKSESFLTHYSRVKESKKYNLKGARRGLCKNSSVAKTRHCKNSSEKNLKVLYKI